MIKSILYERKNSHLLEENPRNGYMLFVVWKNQTYLVEVTLVPFITSKVSRFMEGEKGSHIKQTFLYC
jgi:hypothetical protein